MKSLLIILALLGLYVCLRNRGFRKPKRPSIPTPEGFED